jgi:hypothetical protein
MPGSILPGRYDARSEKTVADLASDVTIVVNAKIDSVNHHFLEELAAQAARKDCGIVGGTVLRPDRTVMTAGLACLSDGTSINPFEGMPHQHLGYMGLAKVVRSVSSISPYVFAFRTSRLLDLGAMVEFREDTLDDLCAALVRSAHAAGLKVVHTPYAVATLDTDAIAYAPRQGDAPPPGLMVNRNLEDFSTVSDVLKTGIA